MNYLDYCINFLSAVKTNQKSPLRLNEKLVILESDDWGAIRTPSAKVLLEFEKYGFNLDKSIYKYDALASETDLNSLFDLLLSIKNAEGEHPVLTANSIMANPDFMNIILNRFIRHLKDILSIKIILKYGKKELK